MKWQYPTCYFPIYGVGVGVGVGVIVGVGVGLITITFVELLSLSLSPLRYVMKRVAPSTGAIVT